ncbi:allantoinase [Bacillus sp. B1-b2]|uniref:allantoinase n=1 Tax=Bacillus sp. B1-b2 TaxID=2653201 RepID=UPI001261D7CC|nr:allantoinase [Bacillus sp. B1-b2]KAB7671161.1 allantoinase [Bacillus sp. B1-b2]
MGRMDLLIKNGTLVQPTQTVQADIGIANGKIVEISANLSNRDANKIIDAKGMHLFPGLIDPHVHFNEPGRADWEGITTGSKSVAAGGGTLYFDMPLNSHPPTISKEAFRMKENLANQKSLVDFRLWGGVVPGNVEELEKLHHAGVIGFKAFMSNSGIEDFSHSDDHTLLESMKKISTLNSILAVHAESDVITEFLGKENVLLNKYSAIDFSNARPIYSEIEAVQRIIAFAEATNCKVHIVHISSAKVLEPILDAKKRGIDISVETCPHYLSLNLVDLEELGSIAKCAPPLRSQQEVDLLWESIRNEEMDVIGSDHSPSLSSMKKGTFLEAWGGISGCQSTLSILLEEGYWKRSIPLEVIAKITSENAAKRFGLYPKKGALSIGSDADIAIVDISETYTLEKEDLFYKNKQSPYIGKTYRGKVKRTISNGKLVYEDDEE